jgi:hypothetical protein
MTEHLQLSRNNLRQAIVETLERRPKQTCKKIDLPNEVCKYSNFNFRGNIRKALKVVIKREIGNLARAQIIREYKAKNVRLRLTPNYIELLEKLLKRSTGRVTVFDSRNPIPKIENLKPENSEHSDFWIDDSFSSVAANSEEPRTSVLSRNHTSFPELPDAIDPSIYDSDASDFDSAWDDDEEIDAADPQLLEVLTSSEIEKLDTLTPTDISKQEKSVGFDFASLRASVEAYTVEYDSLQTEVTINRIQIVAEIQNITATITISLNRPTHSIDFLTHFSELSISPEKLLTISATEQFSSIPGLVYGANGTFVQLRRNLSKPGNIATSLPGVLDEVVADAILVIESNSL